MDNGDFQLRKTQSRIERGDPRIAPVRDFAEEDVRKNLRIQFQLIVLHARQIADRHHAAAEHRELKQSRLAEFRNFQRFVASAEIRGSRLDLIDSGARSERLVIHTDIFPHIAESVGPNPVDGCGERGPDAVDGDFRGIRA